MISDLPIFFSFQYVTQDGYLTSTAYSFNDQAYQSLNQVVDVLNSLSTTTFTNDNQVLSYDGLKAPSKTTAEITTLAASAEDGTIWYDSSIGKLKVLTSGGIETITSV